MTTFYVRTGGGALTTASTYSQDAVNKATGAASGTAPTGTDSISFESNSGNVTMASGTLTITNVTMQTGYAGTITFSSSGSWVVNGSVTLVSTCTIAGTSTGTMTFQGSTTQTLTLAGKIWPQNINVNGASAVLSQADSLSSTGNITVTQGTFTTNNYSVGAASFNFNTSNTKTLNLGTSTFTLTGTSPLTGSSTNTTHNGSTATFVFTNTGSVTISPSIFTYGTFTANAPLSLTCATTGTVTVGTFTRNTTVLGAGTIMSGTLAVTAAFTAGGTADYYQSWVSSTYTTTRSLVLTGATITCDNILFEDISVTGGPITGTLIGDAGNISGITATAGTTLYKLVGTVYDVVGATGWSTSSGGSGSARVPLPQDDVIIDSNSGASVTVENGMRCRSLTVTRSTFSFIASGARGCVLLGHVTLSAGTTWWSTATVYLRRANTTGGITSRTITSNGAVWVAGIIIQAPSSTITLADSLNLGGGNFSPLMGTFAAAGFSITCDAFSSTATDSRNINLSGVTLSLTGTGTIFNTNSSGGFTFTTNSSTLVDILDTSGTPKTVIPQKSWSGGIRYAANNTAACTLNIGNGTTATVTTIWTINNGGSSFQKTIQFRDGATATINPASVIAGTTANPIAVKSMTTGTAAALIAASGIVNFYNVTMRDLSFSGGATFNAWNSTNISNNSGINFLTSAPWKGLGLLRSWVGGAVEQWVGV